METRHEYITRIQREKEDIQIANDNNRKIVLKDYLINELEEGRKIAVHVIEEYNSITILPF